MAVTARRLRSDLKAYALVVIERLFRVFGRPWNEFYGSTIDYQERRTTLDDILSRKPTPGKIKGLYDWWRGTAHVEFMRRHGLKPNHRVLDFGCGYGRTSIPLIKYLDPGNLIGVELSSNRVRLAESWVVREGLQDKKPEFIVSGDNDLPYLPDNSIDVVWTLSVFNHMPDDVLRACLRSLRRALRPDGQLYFYFTVPLPPGEDAAIRRSGSGAFAYFPRSENAVHELLGEVGLAAESLEDWDIDLGDQRPARVRMFLARLVSQGDEVSVEASSGKP